MALQKSFTDKHGLTHSESYSICTVTRQEKIKSGGNYMVDYTMKIYADSDKADNLPVGSYAYSFEVDKALATPVINQCYTDAKTRDEFSGATDA